MRERPIRYLIDEDTPHAIAAGLLRRHPEMDVRVVGGADAPSLSTGDSQLLDFLEERGLILVTRNRQTMPQHLRAHLQKGGHVPGIFILRKGVSYGVILDDLELIWSAGIAPEYRDQITHIPLQ